MTLNIFDVINLTLSNKKTDSILEQFTKDWFKNLIFNKEILRPRSDIFASEVLKNHPKTSK